MYRALCKVFKVGCDKFNAAWKHQSGIEWNAILWLNDQRSALAFNAKLVEFQKNQER